MNAKKFFDGYTPCKSLLLFTYLALICRTHPISAQTELGLIGGVNFSSLRQGNAEDSPFRFSSDIGFKAGAVLDISLNRFLSLRLEPAWLQKGAVFERENPELYGHPYKSRIRLDYAELPVLLRISPFQGAVQPYLLAGGEAGYLLRATEKDLLYGRFESRDIKSHFESFDYGLTYGAGLKFPFIESSTFFIEGRHSIGLFDITTYYSYLPELRTNGIQVMAGTTFTLSQ